MRCIALSNIVQAFEAAHGNQRTFMLRQLRAMPEEMQRAIRNVKVRTENLAGGDGKQDTTIEIKLWDKIRALELGARANGWLKGRVDVTTSEETLATVVVTLVSIFFGLYLFALDVGIDRLVFWTMRKFGVGV